MDLETRVRQLQEQRRGGDVEQLLKAVVINTTDVDARIEGEKLIISSERFTGVHQRGDQKRSECPYKGKGEYQFTGRDDQFDIRFELTHPRVADLYAAAEDVREKPTESTDAQHANLSADGGEKPAEQQTGTFLTRLRSWIRP